MDDVPFNRPAINVENESLISTNFQSTAGTSFVRVWHIKTHVSGFFDTDFHEVSWHFATQEAVRPSGF